MMDERNSQEDGMGFEDFYRFAVKENPQIAGMDRSTELKDWIRERMNGIYGYLVMEGVKLDSRLARVIGGVWARGEFVGYNRKMHEVAKESSRKYKEVIRKR